MAELTYQQSLTEAGLTKDQAAIYETMVKLGPLTASSIAYAAGVGRTLTYKILEELIEEGLVDKKDEPKKVALFFPAHPLKLKEIVEKRLEHARDAHIALDGILNKLASDFNLTSGRPGVRFYEGLDGIRKVAWDSLETRGELRQYADIEAIRKFIPDLNAEYVTERQKRKIKKRTIILDTHGAREYLIPRAPDITDTRFIKTTEAPFQSIMLIYDGKVSYTTLSEEHLIGMIITDPHIFATHRYLFDFAWEKAEIIQRGMAPGRRS